MTLIIGCITNNFGIIAGDTQLTTNGLEREGKTRRSIELKVRKYSNDLMFGILGKWGYFFTTKEAKGVATYFNDYDLLQRCISDIKVIDKLEYLKDFLKRREIIEASAIYVKRNETGFEIDSVTNNGEVVDLKTSTINGSKFVFNEPFFSTDNSYINDKIEKFIAENELDNSLKDSLFLLNNLILEIISNGNAFSISKDGTSYLDVANTVGGYLTIQIMTKSDIHSFNYLGSPYNVDKCCLLDRTTNPFSNYLDNNKIIRYIDNLGMLLKNINNPHNDDEVRASIVELIQKQVLYIDSLDIIEKPDLNKIIDYINQNYELGITNIEIPDTPEVVEDSTDISLANMLFEADEAIVVDVNFLLRFL